MTPFQRWAVPAAIGLALAVAAVLVWRRFDADLALAGARSTQGSSVVSTRCGPIEYQEAGAGVPLLMVHGSGGGHDQGMAFAGALAQQGVRVIAMSRFGYLRTPRPADASPAAQADAHVCLLDALRIPRASVLGASAGAPSALQMALRHPDRVSALMLVVPITFKPGGLADSAPPLSPLTEKALMRLIGSDFLFWAGLQLARDRVIATVLATPPSQVAAASPQERARVNALADGILPVSTRAEGLRDDSALGSHLYDAPLASIRMPTLIVSARDDAYGTYAGARYTASRIAGARFIGFEQGGHVLVGHNEELHAAILQLLAGAAAPVK